jgi:cytochrome P450 family 9
MLDSREGKLKLDESELDDFEKNALIKADTTVDNSLDDDGIVSNCVLFILAGYDTTQSLLLFCAYSLALHPEIQDRLRKEIEESLEETNEEFTYDALHKMIYLDMIINGCSHFKSLT